MADTQTIFPYTYIADPTKGRPVSNGYVYYGLPDLDPEIPANQITVQAKQEDGTLVALPQPVRTNAGGITTYQGSPIIVIIEESEYSIKVLNSAQSQVFYTQENNVSFSLPSDSVGTAELEDDAVTTVKIEDSAVTTSKIDDEAVTTLKLDDGAVTTAKIDNGAVETSKLADESATFPKMQHIAQNNILGRFNAGTGDVEEVVPADARTMLGLGALAVLDGFTGFLGGGAENFQFRVPIQGEDDYVIFVQCFNVNQTMTQKTHNFPVAYSGAVASLPVVFAQGYGITGQKVSPTYSVDNSGEVTTLTVSDFHLVSTSGNTRDVAILSIGLIEA